MTTDQTIMVLIIPIMSLLVTDSGNRSITMVRVSQD